MRDATLIADLQAQIADLRDRIAWMEQRLQGSTRPQHVPWDLTSLYVLACKNAELTGALVELWRYPLRTLGVADFLTIARRMRDPFPWKPFLVLLARCQADGHDVRAETEWVWAKAQELLDLQGLSLLRPGDVMGYPIRSDEAARRASASAPISL